MTLSKRPFALAAFGLGSLMLCLTGCVVHDREVVHHEADAGYEKGYQEGYYDREHNRWWHESAWHDCEVNDVHCHH